MKNKKYDDSYHSTLLAFDDFMSVKGHFRDTTHLERLQRPLLSKKFSRMKMLIFRSGKLRLLRANSLLCLAILSRFSRKSLKNRSLNLQAVRWWTVFRYMKHLQKKLTMEQALLTENCVCRISLKRVIRLRNSLPIF